MRRTTTTLNRFTTFITNWWANTRIFPGGLFLALLILLSCDDNLSEIGLKSPNRDFSVFAKEFVIPTKVFQVDSLITSYGYTVSPGVGILTHGESRFMCGSINDPRFGKTTAIAYAPYYAASYPTTNASASFTKITLTLIFDYYWAGSEIGSEQEFKVYELNDSIITYLPHFPNSSTPYGRLLGEGTHSVSPLDFNQNIIDNGDLDDTNNITDSLTITLDESLGRELLAAAMDTAGTNENNYILFSKFRKRFKGLAIVSPNSDKIVGFDPVNTKSRITVDYSIDTTKYQLLYRFDTPGTAVGSAEYMFYTQIQTDRSGTPLADLPAKYQDYEPSDGMRYIQAGAGIVTKLDLSEVIDHFKDIPVKSLTVAELSIETDAQLQAPSRLLLRALKPNNREAKTSTIYIDGAGDPDIGADLTYYVNHLLFPYPTSNGTNTYDRPFYRADAVTDDGGLFVMSKTTDSGTDTYKGYLTNFLQQELANTESDVFRYYALIPQTPDIARGVNGLYFPADKIKLRVYYTTPSIKE